MHIIKLDTAKEMAMLERNEKGKQVRRYFIQVEKKYKDIQRKPISQIQNERLLEFMDEQSKTSRFQQELIIEVTERLERLEKSKADQGRDSELLIPVRSMTFKDRMKKLNEVVSSLAKFYGVEQKTALHKLYDGLNVELDVNLNTFLTAYRVETGNEDSCPLHAIAYYERIFSKAMALSFDTLRLDRMFNGVA